MNKIYVVGLGPGAGDQMTVQAKKVLDNITRTSIVNLSGLDSNRNRLRTDTIPSRPALQENF